MSRTCHRRTGLMQVILGIAMRAKLGTADATSLRLAVIAANKEFSPQDALRSALQDFADQFDRIRRDPESLTAEGDKLFNAVRRATWPSACSRADIEG